MTAEDQARELGFVYNDRLQKWIHPEHRNYATLKARYAIEDYNDLMRLAQKKKAA